MKGTTTKVLFVLFIVVPAIEVVLGLASGGFGILLALQGGLTLIVAGPAFLIIWLFNKYWKKPDVTALEEAAQNPIEGIVTGGELITLPLPEVKSASHPQKIKLAILIGPAIFGIVAIGLLGTILELKYNEKHVAASSFIMPLYTVILLPLLSILGIASSIFTVSKLRIESRFWVLSSILCLSPLWLGVGGTLLFVQFNSSSSATKPSSNKTSAARSQVNSLASSLRSTKFTIFAPTNISPFQLNSVYPPIVNVYNSNSNPVLSLEAVVPGTVQSAGGNSHTGDGVDLYMLATTSVFQIDASTTSCPEYSPSTSDSYKQGQLINLPCQYMFSTPIDHTSVAVYTETSPYGNVHYTYFFQKGQTYIDFRDDNQHFNTSGPDVAKFIDSLQPITVDKLASYYSSSSQ